MNTKQISRSPLRTIVYVSVSISALLSLIVSSSFIGNRLEADEEWMVFGEYAGFRYDFWQGLLNVGSYALFEVSTYGRLRFAYPFTEIAGGSATNLIESLLGLDPMLAYGLWRVLVVAGIAAMFIALVFVLTSNASFSTRAWAIFLSGFAIPAAAIAPDRLAGFRVFPSHYGLMAIVGILFVVGVWWLFEKYPTIQGSRNRWFALAGFGIVGLIMVASSEFFYALGPAMVVGRLVRILLARTWNIEVRAGQILPLAVFATGFMVSLLAVRIVLGYFCAQSSFCYSRTKVTLGVDSFLDGSFVFVGRLPFVAQVAGISRGEVELSNYAVPFVVLTTIALAFYWFVRNFKSGDLKTSSDAKEMLNTGLVLVTMGIAWSFSTAFAISSTEAFGRGPLGSAGSEAIQLAIGSSLILVGAGLVIVYLVMGLRKRFLSNGHSGLLVASSTATAAFLFMIVGAWAINTSSAANESDVEDIIMQREVSVRVITPDVAGNYSAQRCELIVRKMSTFPRWKGHEDTVLWGLNLRYQKNYQVDFCSFETVNSALEESGLR